MTGHAFAKDRERCRAALMLENDRLTTKVMACNDATAEANAHGNIWQSRTLSLSECKEAGLDLMTNGNELSIEGNGQDQGVCFGKD